MNNQAKCGMIFFKFINLITNLTSVLPTVLHICLDVANTDVHAG